GRGLAYGGLVGDTREQAVILARLSYHQPSGSQMLRDAAHAPREEVGLLHWAHEDVGVLTQVLVERGRARLGGSDQEEVGERARPGHALMIATGPEPYLGSRLSAPTTPCNLPTPFPAAGAVTPAAPTWPSLPAGSGIRADAGSRPTCSRRRARTARCCPSSTATGSASTSPPTSRAGPQP